MNMFYIQNGCASYGLLNILGLEDCFVCVCMWEKEHLYCKPFWTTYIEFVFLYTFLKQKELFKIFVFKRPHP